MTRPALLALAAILAALVAVATLLYATHRRDPEYAMSDWDEDDEGVQPAFLRDGRVWTYNRAYRDPEVWEA